MQHTEAGDAAGPNRGNSGKVTAVNPKKRAEAIDASKHAAARAYGADPAVARLLCADYDFARRYLGTQAVLCAALPVVLDALAACESKQELKALLALMIDTNAQPYRQRMLELLGAQVER